jgi:hypothetical protein
MESVDFFSFSPHKEQNRAAAYSENSPAIGLFFFVQRIRISRKDQVRPVSRVPVQRVLLYEIELCLLQRF